MNQSERRYDIFISYSSKDQKLIDALCHFLEARNLRCFVAYRDVPKGEDWASYIVKAIRKCKVFVYVHSQSSNKSAETTKELQLAFGTKCVVIPFRIENIDYISAKKYRLTNVNWLDAFPDKPEKYLGKLFDIIKPNFPDRIVEYDDKKRKFEEQERQRRECKERREASLKNASSTHKCNFRREGKVFPWIAGATLCVGLFLWIAPMIKSCINESVTVTGTETITENNSEIETFMVNGVSFKMVKVAGGTFQMGATSEQGKDAEDDELPVHSVTLFDYYIGQTEVTQELWEAVMGSNPSYFKGDNQRPVESVSWNDCQEFIEKLNRLTGKNFRLPTEAEWEYAARGGSKSRGYKYSGSNNPDAVAWYNDNSGDETPPVAQKQSNELGLYDMSGNVLEWCSDRYGDYSSNSQINPTGASGGSYRVLRGGSLFNDAWFVRVSFRGSGTPDLRLNDSGLRLAF